MPSREAHWVDALPLPRATTDEGNSTAEIEHNRNFVWDTGSATWVKMTQPGAGGGGGGPVTVADGADVTQGAIADAAVTGDNTGTVSAKLRGISKILANVWDSVNGRLKVDGSGVTQPVSGTITANAGTNLNTSALALDATLTGGSQKAIARGGAKGTTAAADLTSNPVDANTQALHVDGSKVTQPVSGTVTSNQGTAAALSGAWPSKVTDGTNTMPTMDAVARKGFIGITDGTNGPATVKAASTAVAATDLPFAVGLHPSSPVPAGTNRIGLVRPVDSADADLTAAKGTQTSRFLGVTEAKDAGRVNIAWTAEVAGAATTEGLLTITESRDGAATTTFSSKVVTSGKRLRITSMQIAVESLGSGTAPQRVYLRMRFNTAGAVTTASPIQASWECANNPAVVKTATSFAANFPDGIEYLGDGTKQIGFTIQFPDWVTTTATVQAKITITAFEY